MAKFYENIEVQGTVSATTLYVSGNSVTRPYKVYTALLTQGSTDAPTAIVLENTLGVISFTYVSQGFYQVISEGLFTINKTTVPNFDYCVINPSYNNQRVSIIIDSGTIQLKTSQGSNISNLQNNQLDKTLFEIRVYN